MELETLKTFVLVFRKKSFAAAARELGVAPSSVSRTVATLEDELGLRLFQRTTRKLSATEAGTIYHDRVAPLIDELERAKAMAADVSDAPSGRLRIASSVIFAQRFVVPLLPGLTQEYPKLSFELILDNTHQDLVAEGIDMAIRVGKLPDSSLVARKLVPMDRRLVAAPAYLAQHGTPQTPQDLSEHDGLLLPHEGYAATWRFRDSEGRVEKVNMQSRCTVGNGDALLYCARAGMGMALLPRWLVTEDLASGQLIDLFSDLEATQTEFDAALWLVYPSREYVPLKVRVFVDRFVALFP